MNRNLIIGLIVGLLIAVGGIVIFAGSGDDDLTTSVSVVDMSVIPDDLEAAVTKAIERQSESNVVVVDVRTDEEWNESHAVDAFHWGLAEQLENGNLPPLGKNMEIYVYCRSGNRAGQAIKILQDAGYTNLTNIRGLEDWVTAGGTTTTGVDGDDQGLEVDLNADNAADTVTSPEGMSN